MGIFSVLGCELGFLYASGATFSESLSIGSGYVALGLLAATLLIGPFNLIFKRRNSVNINLRRDVGIWSGIMGIVHVIFSFQLYNDGDILSFFWPKEGQNSASNNPLLFFFSNYTGLIATLLLIALLITSNQLSLVWLKGKRWKLLQRFNYPLVALVVIHTFGYQALNVRETTFVISVTGLSLIIVAVQLGGVVVTLQRNNKRKQEHGAPAVTEGSLEVAPELATVGTLARRQFLIGGGALLLGSFTAGTLVGLAINNKAKQETNPDAVASAPTNTPAPDPTATAEPARPTPANNGRPFDRGQPQPGNNGQSNVGGRGNPAQNPPPTSASSNPTNPPTTASSGSNSAGNTAQGVVLATLTSLRVGNALKFTTPDTGEAAFLIHETDGSVKAFSGICTHRPYDLVYSTNQQALVCNLHNVLFNVTNGAPQSRPARTSLLSFKVQTDAKGNILYVQG